MMTFTQRTLTKLLKSNARILSRNCQTRPQALKPVLNQKPRDVMPTQDLFQRVLQRFPKGSSSDKDYDWPLAFAYGSGVFKQEGNISRGNMVDFVLVVEDSENWHAQNLIMNPKDYSGLMSMLGSVTNPI